MQTTITLAGVEVPRIGLGTNRLKHTPEHVEFIRQAVDAGVRHIDTAHLYTGGESERAIGDALENVDAELVLATKGGYHGGAPDVLQEEIEQSLRSLKTDRIALYYLHRVDADVALERSLEAIKEHVDRGAIGAVGISEVTVEEIERARAVLDIAAVQNEYNMAERRYDDVVDYCAEHEIVFVPFYPLRGGDGLSNADKLRRLLDRSPAVAPIPGTLSLEHLRENLTSLS
jgi:aryl-alcohol dehydrogenase-like predicted oxidoreductase